MVEEEALIEYLRSGTSPPSFEDDLHSRLVGALRDSSASDLDRAVLLRQLLRRWSLRDGRDVPVELKDEFCKSVRKKSAYVGIRERVDGMWVAERWQPEWLELDGGVPDAAALAGTSDGARFHTEPLRADHFFTAITGFDNYRTPGQRAACRAVMSAPEGSTVISMLPTGSGKTEVALCLAERAKYGLTVIVVPTVALAYDFERRFRDHFARRNRRVNPESLNFAWTASTDEATRERLKHAVSQGQQPLLVSSPESMTRALRKTLLDAASIGRLQGFVVDEAHLVTQWGRFFRPEFRTLADLRRDLLQQAQEGGHARAITLLLSATLGAAEMDDIMSLFGDPGPCSPVVANALRAEPDIWIAPPVDAGERATRVLDTLAHCARPTVLYVTKPEKAEQWLSELRAVGYSRIATVTGATRAADRASVLQGIRANPGSVGALDLVVATSAFGLGIDYPHIRSIVHACLPETVDRWHQELGRGGRDGDVSAAFLLTALGDDSEAASMGVKVLSPEIAEKRWIDIWGHREDANGRTFVDLEGARGSVGRGDYNRRWNAQVIQGLIELGELRREQYDLEDIRELLNKDDVEVFDWTAVSRVAARIGAPSFWEDVWLPWQQREMSRSSESLRRVREVSRLTVGACSGIAEAYAPSEELRQTWGNRLQFMEPVGACGKCPDCRRRGEALHADPPPSPEQVWAVTASDFAELGRFVTAARGVNGLAFLTFRPGEGGLGSSIAAGLTALGVRHFGGLPEVVQGRQGEVTFFDEFPLSPVELTPVPSFSFFSPGQPVSRRWLARRECARIALDGHSVADILMVPDGTTIGGRLVGKDIPSVAAATALDSLPKG
jgi:superfamily II DNA or RNA helicase